MSIETMEGATLTAFLLLTVAAMSAGALPAVTITTGAPVELTVKRSMQLNCRYGPDGNITGVEWLRPDSKPLPFKPNCTEVPANISAFADDCFLPLVDVRSEDTGTYVCQVYYNDSTGLQKNVSARIVVSVIPRVNVTALDGQQKLAMLGEDIRMNCSIAEAYDDRFYWTRVLANGTVRNATELNATRWVENAMNYSYKAQRTISLLVKAVQADDEGGYRCYAYNNLSDIHYDTISLKVRDKFAALWPFLGFLIEVLILCGIIYLFERRRNKKLAREVVTAEQVPLAGDRIVKKTTTTITTTTRT